MTIRFAESREDIVFVHRFMMFVAAPVIEKNLGFTLDDIDPVGLMETIRHVVEDADGCVILAERNGHIVGMLGMEYMQLYYLKPGRGFYGDRLGFFVDPVFKDTDVGARIRAEADAVAAEHGTFFLPHPKLRRRDLPAKVTWTEQGDFNDWTPPPDVGEAEHVAH